METEQTHNDDFLKGLKLNKNPFKAPDNYFNNLSEDINTTYLAQQLPNSTGFKVPNHYFENFKVPKTKSKIILLLPYVSVAAAITVGLFLFNARKNDSFSNNDIVEYLALDNNMGENEIVSYSYIDSETIFKTSIEDINIDIEEIALEIEDYDLIEF